MLASKGFDIEKYKKQSQNITIRQTFEPQEPCDIDGYLTHEREMILLGTVEEAKRVTSQQFEDSMSRFMENEWKNDKKHLLQIMGLRKVSQIQPTPSKPSYGGHPVGTPASKLVASSPFVQGKRGRTMMDARMSAYSAVVFELNKSTGGGGNFQLIQRFKTISQQFTEQGKKNEVTENFDLLQFILDEPNIKTSAKVYKQEYEQKSFCFSILNKSKQYLERQYQNYLRDAYQQTKNQQNQQNQPQIDSITLIRQHVQNVIRSDNFKHTEIVDGLPYYAQIFYCLRCGFIDDAIKIADDANKQLNDNKMSAYLKYYKENRDLRNPLSPKLLQEMQQEYRIGGASFEDQFKQAVYLVLGKCDPKRTIPSIFSKTEDYLWLRLSVSDVDGTEGSGASFEDLRALILRCGSSHFNSANSSGFMYFKILMLTQQFEDAICYLQGVSPNFLVETVHFAIALNYYGVLRVSKDMQAVLLSTQQINNVNVKSLNFNILIREYVKLFAHTDPYDAVSYLCLIEDAQSRREYIQELIQTSGDVSTLLGTITADGLRKKGCIEEFFRDSSEVLQIVDNTAKAYLQTGNYPIAIDLFFVAEELRRPDEDTSATTSPVYIIQILNLVNELLSQVVLGDSPSERRVDILLLAQKVHNKLNQEGLYYRLQNDRQFRTFLTLASLSRFIDLYYKQNYAEALQYLERQVQLIPFDSGSMEARVRAFQTDLDEKVQRNFGDVLLAAMRCIYSLYKKSRPNTREAADLREKAKQLVLFAGRITDRTRSDVSGQLIKIEIMMR